MMFISDGCFVGCISVKGFLSTFLPVLCKIGRSKSSLILYKHRYAICIFCNSIPGIKVPWSIEYFAEVEGLIIRTIGLYRYPFYRWDRNIKPQVAFHIIETVPVKTGRVGNCYS